MRKKVGIMTMQRIFNYGSFLQAYALKKIIEDFDYRVQFVDYHPGKTLVTDTNNGTFRKLKKAVEALKLKTSLKNKFKFICYKKDYAQQIFPLLGIDNRMNYNTTDLDDLVIGSDEVFNCVQSNPNVGYSVDLFGKNNRAKKLISYAASFGNTTIEKLDKYGVLNEVKENLAKFDSLSVRDTNSEKIVASLTGKTPNVNVDPVLAYFDKIRLNNVLKEVRGYSKDSYLIVYGYTGRFSIEEAKLIRKFAHNKGLKIVCLGGIQHYCDDFVNADPFEVLGLFRNAKYIITDTFHGTIMSIINERPFVTVIRNKGYGNSQKLGDLLVRLNLEDRQIYDFAKVDRYFAKTINYGATSELLDKYRKETVKYLEEAL